MLAYVNGSLVAQERATVSVFDRGFLFGDGVYEMVRYFDGVGVALDLHIARLQRSLAQTGIQGFAAESLRTIAAELLEANSLADASIYLQVTRGAGTQRMHMPTPGMQPTVVGLAAATLPLREFTQPDCLRAIALPDPRWQRCAIKTISLAGNILCLMHAQAAGADECILLRDGMVGEGAYTNVAVVHQGRMSTCALDEPTTPVLHGTMRAWVLEAARESGIGCTEGPVSEHALRTADEVLVMSSRRLVSAVTALDGTPVGQAIAGPVCRTLFARMRDRIAVSVRSSAGSAHAHC